MGAERVSSSETHGGQATSEAPNLPSSPAVALRLGDSVLQLLRLKRVCLKREFPVLGGGLWWG